MEPDCATGLVAISLGSLSSLQPCHFIHVKFARGILHMVLISTTYAHEAKVVPTVHRSSSVCSCLMLFHSSIRSIIPTAIRPEGSV